MLELAGILVVVAKEHPVIAAVIAIVILLGFLSWRRAKAIPPVRIDRKVLRVMHREFSENWPVTTSTVYGYFLDTPPGILDQSIGRLMTMGYIDATKELRGGPLYPNPYYKVTTLTEKGYRAARASCWWIPLGVRWSVWLQSRFK